MDFAAFFSRFSKIPIKVFHSSKAAEIQDSSSTPLYWKNLVSRIDQRVAELIQCSWNGAGEDYVAGRVGIYMPIGLPHEVYSGYSLYLYLWEEKITKLYILVSGWQIAKPCGKFYSMMISGWKEVPRARRRVTRETFRISGQEPKSS